ncbi:tetratricopeptide repeat protein [Pseudomonas solani]|uniref:tetratricopeptide repeat protein n=1 Tax=Pseudomonas TaxID=286 RepID=UPI0021E0EEA9|nr:tetratricopeptide repeat protein [Pseudomonas sp. PDM13]MCU9946570.1 tetratricopeptide repeat protein [Pseudomonas sp. PDM13]
MRTLIILALLAGLAGCTRWSLDHHLNNAYLAYDEGDCDKAMLELSQAERKSRSRAYMQPEISLLRGQCLERQSLFVDAQQTYNFIIGRYPTSEYAYRARARLETLEKLGQINTGSPAKASPASL